MKIVNLIARILLGLMFTVFGLNGLHPFLSMPMPTGLAGQYMLALFVSHYAYAIFGAQLLSGILLLANRFVPLAVTILAGIIVNILSYHLAMNPEGLPLALVAAVLWLGVFLGVRRSFAGIFAARTSMTPASR
jgi:putative oxidoreductase